LFGVSDLFVCTSEKPQERPIFFLSKLSPEQNSPFARKGY